MLGSQFFVASAKTIKSADFARAAMHMMLGPAPNERMVRATEKVLLIHAAAAQEVKLLQMPAGSGERDMILAISKSMYRAAGAGDSMFDRLVAGPSATFYDWMEALACAEVVAMGAGRSSVRSMISFSVLPAMAAPVADQSAGYFVRCCCLLFPNILQEIQLGTMGELHAMVSALHPYHRVCLAKVAGTMDPRCIGPTATSASSASCTVYRESRITMTKLALIYLKRTFDRLNEDLVRASNLPLFTLYTPEGLQGLLNVLYTPLELDAIRKSYVDRLRGNGIHPPLVAGGRMPDGQPRCEPFVGSAPLRWMSEWSPESYWLVFCSDSMSQSISKDDQMFVVYPKAHRRHVESMQTLLTVSAQMNSRSVARGGSHASDRMALYCYEWGPRAAGGSPTSDPIVIEDEDVGGGGYLGEGEGIGRDTDLGASGLDTNPVECSTTSIITSHVMSSSSPPSSPERTEPMPRNEARSERVAVASLSEASPSSPGVGAESMLDEE